MNEFIEKIKHINPEALVLDGYDDCIIGIVQNFNGCVLLYDSGLILETMVERDGMTEEEAIEYYDFNIIGAYISEYNPVFTLLE